MKLSEPAKAASIFAPKRRSRRCKGGKQQIVITEIPYQVIKSRLVTAMENIRIEKKVEGIAEVRDESGRDGLRIVVELRKDADAEGIIELSCLRKPICKLHTTSIWWRS